ncbi:hypothetical protein PSTG_15951 [Puccinia striiformis f. sp. tritici PST-78]|uniref:BED-type domain-containing protein n=1 Tax=Puccinia striiformis f. sp. tritici PST-78 TaxID=1165861 RepID=A0A0L0UUC5_9BASI|nr:hypothetical protein PSTG_15951 [Puccinia striiformis f. sp. tritici PST-78]
MPGRKRQKASAAISTSSSQPRRIMQTGSSKPNDGDLPPNGEEHIPTPTPSSVQPPSAITADDLEELKKAMRVAANALSSSYKSYMPPKLSNQQNKQGKRMIAYPCKLCGTRISQPTSDSSCGNLNQHVATCWMKQSESNKNQTLVGLGIKGTGDINPQEVNQLCAIWCAEAARPFSALIEASHKALLHQTIRRALPGRQTVSTDIHMLYSAVQKNYKTVLETHTGALYLGVDAWQSPNGFDILGTVVY